MQLKQNDWSMYAVDLEHIHLMVEIFHVVIGFFEDPQQTASNQ